MTYKKKTKIIDCTIPCPLILKTLSSCPTRKINLNTLKTEDLNEIIMIILSLLPYLINLVILISMSYFRTTRIIFIFLMETLQNIIVNYIKNLIQEPRPNFKCNHQFGNPCYHSSFFTCLIFWFFLETIFTSSKKKFKYKKVLVFLYFIYPFILYSRFYLNYHSIKQIINGVILGFFISFFWFFTCIKFILKSDNILKRIFIKLNIKNTLTEDEICSNQFFQNDNLFKQYQSLLDKNEKIEKLKKDLERITQNINSLDFMKE